MEATSQATQGNQMPIYVRVKRRRDEPPPPFLCVLRPQKRQQRPDREPSGVSVLERALIFKHVDAAPPPVPPPFFSEGQTHSQEPDELQQPQTSKIHATVYRTQKHLTGETAHADQGSTGVTGKLAATEERTIFWNAFNTPLRQEVFGSFADTGPIEPTRLEYRDVVEEAVKSLRRFRVDSLQQGERLFCHSNAQQTNVLLHAGNAVQVLDVCPDGCHAATDLSDEQAASHEFEYDLYAIECDSGECCPWKQPGRLDTHKQSLLELLQQDPSAVALVEVEDVDQETGIVTRGKGSMQVFLEEFGDIDDSDSDEDGEIDYPSGGSSDDRERCRPRSLWDSAFSGSGSSRSSQSEGDEYFDDDEC